MKYPPRRKRGFTVDGIPYRDYIKSPEWADVKARYQKSRLPKKCMACGSKNYDLHHRTYKRLGKEWLTDLVPLCREHHDQTHALKPTDSTLYRAHSKLCKDERKRIRKQRSREQSKRQLAKNAAQKEAREAAEWRESFKAAVAARNATRRGPA